MAYVDLVSTQLTPIKGGTTYNFSFDTPVSQDGSPHLTHIGFQIDGAVSAGANYKSGGIGRLISNYRIKVGSNTLLDFNDPAPAADALVQSNLSFLAAKVGGWDACAESVADSFIGELTLPFGIDATRSHRINVTLTLNNEEDWCGQTFDVAATEFNMVMYYGTATDSTLYGSRQDFTLTNGATRAITAYGKTGWNMLGIAAINDADVDQVSEIRSNNGAFRALKVEQWRVLDSTYTQGVQDTKPDSAVWSAVTKRAGFVFLDLKRLTAGADISLMVTSSADTTYSFFPVWVAPIGRSAGNPTRQTQKSISNTASDVNSQSKI